MIRRNLSLFRDTSPWAELVLHPIKFLPRNSSFRSFCWVCTLALVDQILLTPKIDHPILPKFLELLDTHPLQDLRTTPTNIPTVLFCQHRNCIKNKSKEISFFLSRRLFTLCNVMYLNEGMPLALHAIFKMEKSLFLFFTDKREI
jgi:hypothetical protein